MKKSLYYSIGFFILAIFSGFSLVVNITALYITITEESGPASQLVFFGIIFLVMMILAIYQGIIWLLRFFKAKNINENQE